MITITNRKDNRLSHSDTARFDGAHHGADVSIFWVNADVDTGTDPHWHPYTETWVVIDGEALVRANGEELHVGAGDIVTVGARTIHSFKNCGADRLHMICTHASPEIIQEFVGSGPYDDASGEGSHVDRETLAVVTRGEGTPSRGVA